MDHPYDVEAMFKNIEADRNTHETVSSGKAAARAIVHEDGLKAFAEKYYGKVMRIWKLKKMFTPYEQDGKFTDQSIYECDKIEFSYYERDTEEFLTDGIICLTPDDVPDGVYEIEKDGK